MLFNQVNMETSIFLARVFSVTYLAFGLGLLFSADYYKKELSKFLDNFSYTMLGGYMALIAGMAMVTYHNTWNNDWTVLVTIVGWLALIKGVLLLVFPGFVSFFKPMLKPENLNMFVTPVVLVLGIVFGYFGFFA